MRVVTGTTPPPGRGRRRRSPLVVVRLSPSLVASAQLVASRSWSPSTVVLGRSRGRATMVASSCSRSLVAQSSMVVMRPSRPIMVSICCSLLSAGDFLLLLSNHFRSLHMAGARCSLPHGMTETDYPSPSRQAPCPHDQCSGMRITDLATCNNIQQALMSPSPRHPALLPLAFAFLSSTPEYHRNQGRRAMQQGAPLGSVALRRPRAGGSRDPRRIRWLGPTRRTPRSTAGSPAPQQPARNGRVERSGRRHARRQSRRRCGPA